MSRLRGLTGPAHGWEIRWVAHALSLSSVRLMTVSMGRPASHPCSCPFVDVSTSATGQIQKPVSLPMQIYAVTARPEELDRKSPWTGARQPEGRQQNPPVDHLTLYVVVEVLQGQRLALPPCFQCLSRGEPVHFIIASKRRRDLNI